MSYLRHIMSILVVVLLIDTLAAVAQEATPEPAASAIELTERYKTPDNKISIRYPTDWEIEIYENPNVMINANIATNASAINKNIAGMGESGSFLSGEALLQVLVMDICKLNRTNLEHTSAAEVLYNSYAIYPQQNIEYGEIRPTIVRGRFSAQLHVISEDQGEGIMIQTILEPCIVATFTIGTVAGELERWKTTFLAFIESLTYTPLNQISEPTLLPLTQSYVSDDNLTTFNYPSGWVIEEHEPAHPAVSFSINLATSTSVLDKKAYGFHTGEASVSIGMSDICELGSSLLQPDMNAAELLENSYTSVPQDSFAYSDIEPVFIDEYQAARTLSLSMGRGEGFVMNIKYNECMVVFLHLLPPLVNLTSGCQLR